ncbi:nitrous oxide reductase accessory protein NosL [Pseudophaeobacter arcticus]|jgi:copper chaperone NosL|uniref:nitrous oxide reductase accessory protein NosL n=2 Tax=Pseudophaeobacter arcticus TaxID=385492 RepID=UPI0039E631FC
MKPGILIALAALLLSACKEDETALPLPIEMTAEAVGYYCQMDLLNHEGPKGQIHLAGMAAPIFLSQVRDTIAYLHMPEQSHAVQATYVQDMANAESWAKPGSWIAANKALYVVGSDQMGGMGAPEFVPFSDEAAAANFIANHGGALLRFDEIKPQDVLSGAAPELAAADQSDIANRLRALAPADRTN